MRELNSMKNICCELWDFGGGFMRPLRGRDIFLTFSVGFTRGYPGCCPSDNGQKKFDA
jgi:hypothetical protein